jgi:hypothetical protein
VRPSRDFLVTAIFAIAGCGTEKATAPEPVADTVAPVIELFTGPDTAALGGIVELRLLARDSVSLKGATLSFSGAFEASRWFDFEEDWNGVTLIFTVQMPWNVDPALAVIATMTVSDRADNTAEAQIPIFLKDTTKPVASLYLGGLHYDGTIGTGETVDLYVNAGDNHRLTYIGYEVAGTRDSVPASGSGDSHTFRLTVPPSWRLQRPVFVAWSRDASRNGSLPDTMNVRTIPVYDWIDRSVQSFPMFRDTGPTQALWDEKRNAIYRLRYGLGQAGGPQIDGAFLIAGMVLPAVSLPTMPQSFAFTGTGDSLAVTFSQQRTLGIVDLLPPARTLATIPLHYEGEVMQYGEVIREPRYVQAAGGRLFVSLVNGYVASRLLEVNVSTGEQVLRMDMAGAANPNLLQLPDGRLYSGPEVESSDSLQQQVIYSPESNSFTSSDRLRPATMWQYSASPSGRIMLGSYVYNASLARIAIVRTQDWKEDEGGSPAAAISADGTTVYLATNYGYEQVRLSDGFLLEQVRLEMRPRHLIATRDGTRLIAVGESAVKLVDLR